jgi:hypothetical protein
MSDDLLYPPEPINCRCVMPGPLFWPAEILELAQRCDRDSELVVADWLEENGCRRAAECFRLPSYTVWRSAIVHAAKAAPETPPRGDFLEYLALLVRQVHQQDELARSMIAGMSPGGDLSTGLEKLFGPTIPKELPPGED